MNPKFSINEVVILKSKHFPQDNGETTVTGSAYKEILFNKTTMQPMPAGWIYTLEGRVGTWAEEALQKRHEKGSMSFKELIKDLKTNIQERA